jgi:hypothetical protein
MVVLRQSCEPQACEPQAKQADSAQRPAVFLVTFPGHGVRATITTHGDAAEVQPFVAAPADLADLAVVLHGVLVNLAIRLSAQPLLHATVVDLDGAGIAVIGPSGVGKTVAAALAVAGGCSLVTDDAAAITYPTDSDITIPSGMTSLRLRQDPSGIGRALAEAVTQAPLTVTEDGRLSARPTQSTRTPIPLRLIVSPRSEKPRTGSLYGSNLVHPTHAVALLVSSMRFSGWTEPTFITEDFVCATRLADTVPMYQLDLPEVSPQSIPDVSVHLVEQLASLLR